MYIDFSTIETGEDFELLCEDLLLAMNFQIVSKPARGADQGKDLVAVQTISDAAGFSETHRYLIECKHRAISGKSVTESEIGNVVEKMSLNKCTRYILITSTVPSENAARQLDGISNLFSSLKATAWSKGDLRRFLDLYPEVRNRHFKPALHTSDSDRFQLLHALRRYLEESHSFNLARELILQHPELLPIERYMLHTYEFRRNVQVPEGGVIDCMAARPDTLGIRGYMYYLGSPFDDPFTRSGEPLGNLVDLLNFAQEHAGLACHPLSEEHPLHPLAITGIEGAGMTQWYYDDRDGLGFGPYGSLYIYIIVGQNKKRQPLNPRARTGIIVRWLDNFRLRNQGVSNGCLVGLEVMSYSRLLHMAAPNPGPQPDRNRASHGPAG